MKDRDPMASLEERQGLHAVAPRPLTELLACPGPLEQMLGANAERRDYGSGDVVFSQNQECAGLYLLLAGEFARSALRREKRLSLGILRAGELIDLASVLGNSRHNYTITAVGPSAALLFPMSSLEAAFEEYPPLRMHLLEELGREVSRAYGTVYVSRKTRVRHIATAS